jgi:hypothetical protein
MNTKTIKTKEAGIIINSDTENLNLIPFRDFGERFKKELKLHKMFMNQLIKNQDSKMIPAIVSSGEELAMVYANFKCEKCGVVENLQYHHLIQRNVRGFINDSKYLSQRYYWANISVLCNKCHAEFHGFKLDKFLKESLCISNEKINKLKILYKINNLELNN